MLRVRTASGKGIEVDEPLKYVEILDKNENVAMVFYKEKFGNDEVVNIVHPGMDDDMALYSQMFKVKWTDVMKGDWPEVEPMELSSNTRTFLS